MTNESRAGAPEGPVRRDDDKQTGVKMLVLVFGLPLLLVLLAQFLLF